jgi:hypothetical protein
MSKALRWRRDSPENVEESCTAAADPIVVFGARVQGGGRRECLDGEAVWPIGLANDRAISGPETQQRAKVESHGNSQSRSRIREEHDEHR